jgi:hypothetical protein
MLYGWSTELQLLCEFRYGAYYLLVDQCFRSLFIGIYLDSYRTFFAENADQDIGRIKVKLGLKC